VKQQEALRESEQRFRLLVEAVRDYAIFMLDTEGHVNSWNVGAERIKGYKASEIVGKHFSCFYPEEDIAAAKPQRALEIAAKEGRVEDEGWRLRKDGSRFWANVIITALKDNAGNLIGFIKVTRDITERQERRDAQQKLDASEKSLRRLSLHLLRTQDEERRRIGRELHDSVGQYLSALKMKLDLLNRSTGLPHADVLRRELAECAELSEELIKEIRTISYLLYPPMLDEMGLKSAIAWYVEGFAKRSGIQTHFDVLGNFGRLPRDVEMALFRVLQESLTNAHRHSGSPSADIRLGIMDGHVRLEIRDKGKGMPVANPEEAGRTLGVGLRGMTERMVQLGGTLEFLSSSEGTAVIATVPWEESSSAADSSPFSV
jgi:PAS domain S-box-containing protein